MRAGGVLGKHAPSQPMILTVLLLLLLLLLVMIVEWLLVKIWVGAVAPVVAARAVLLLPAEAIASCLLLMLPMPPPLLGVGTRHPSLLLLPPLLPHYLLPLVSLPVGAAGAAVAGVLPPKLLATWEQNLHTQPGQNNTQLQKSLKRPQTGCPWIDPWGRQPSQGQKAAWHASCDAGTMRVKLALPHAKRQLRAC